MLPSDFFQRSIYARPPYLKAHRKFRRAEYHWWARAFAVLIIGGGAALYGVFFNRDDITTAAWPAALCTSLLPMVAAMRVFRRSLKLIDHAHEIDKKKFNAWLAEEISRHRR